MGVWLGDSKKRELKPLRDENETSLGTRQQVEE
jgi:hypothetical protein